MYINNENDLLQFLPNTARTLEGETSLYEKLYPEIAGAENWWRIVVAGDADSQANDNSLLSLARQKAVACYALVTGIPKLNLILTQNGFGVVSNQNVAPASQERTDALVKLLKGERDDSVFYFTQNVRGALGLAFQNYLHKGLMLAHVLAPEAEDKLEWQTRNVPYARMAEVQIETGVAGAPLMRYMTEKVRQYTSVELPQQLTQDEYDVLQALKMIVYVYLDSNKPGSKEIRKQSMFYYQCEAVELIKKSPVCRELWEQGAAYLLWQDGTIRNDKHTGAYWL